MMEKVIKSLEQMFFRRETDSSKLYGLFDAAGIPDQACWRAVYRAIFDAGLKLSSGAEFRVARDQLEPLMKKALENIQRRDYSEAALTALIQAYNKASFLVCHNQLIEVMDELDQVSGEFKAMSLERQATVETLESETVKTVASDLSITEKVALIKHRFKETIQMFQKDMARLDHMSHTDHLTGLYNRRFFDQQLGSETHQALTEKTWLHLLMIDIDDFKRFNDTYGHLVGDQALKTIAKHIRDACHRESEKTGIYFWPTRYGGEEFALIMPAVDRAHAAEVAQAICATIRAYIFVIRNKKGEIRHKNLNLTVSIGLASLDHRHDQKEGIRELIRQADAAMYTAKRDGKNRVIDYSAL